MIATQNATLDTDTQSFPLTFPRPLTVHEVSDYVRRVILEPEGRYDVSPLVTLGTDGIAHVSLLHVSDTLDDILHACI